jgi:pyruvate dehydrogenase E2 component (dihydrolipoamide acetyltransferase)
MAEVVKMPKMSDTMTDGVVAKWHKKVGDKVKSGDVLAEIETDKATMDFESYQDGVLLFIGVEEGKSVPVDEVIAVLGKEGEDYKSALEGSAAPAAAPAKEEAKPAAPVADKAPAATPAPAAKVDTSSIPATVIRMPALSDTMTEGIINKWNFKVGDKVKSDDSLADVETDKATMEVVGYEEGTLLYIGPKEGEAAPVNGIIAIVGKEGTDITPLLQDAPAASAEAAPAADKAPAATESAPAEEEKETSHSDSRVKASPLARKISEILFTAPHFYVTMSIDMDQAIAARNKINEVAPVKISFNDFVLKASAIALRQHPTINSSWLGDKIRTNEHINIGVAVAVDEGLLVPVIRFADGKSLSHISVEVKDFAQRAKAKKLQPADWEGSTFTISNLGMFGVDEFTAIINSPDSCILAVSGIQAVPVVKNGAVVPGNIMKVTLSADHRVVDGAAAAAFLQTLKQLLEEPVRLLI